MAEEYPELDAMQRNYRAAVDAWVTTIRREETLASVNHTVAQIDQWENAAMEEDQARDKARTAKKTYEDALREKFFSF
jgi:hypothetical protein